MACQTFQINHLHALRRQQVQNRRLGRAGIAIKHHNGRSHGRVIQLLDHQGPPAFIPARNRINPPANLRQDRGKRPRPLPTPPAIDQRAPAPRHLGQGALQMGGHIARHQRAAQFARRKG